VVCAMNCAGDVLIRVLIRLRIGKDTPLPLTTENIWLHCTDNLPSSPGWFDFTGPTSELQRYPEVEEFLSFLDRSDRGLVI